MKPNFIVLLLLLPATSALSGKPPFTSVHSESIQTGPMMEIKTSTWSYYDGDMDTAVTAEWVTQKTPMGKQRKFNLTKKGIVYAVDLDTRHCTKTDVTAITGSIKNPEALAKNMKQQMGLKKEGTCEGAGFKGIKYTSGFGEMCFYKDIFLLWQNMMGNMTKVTKAEFDITLPKDKITLPAGIKCVQGPDLSQGWQGIQTYSNSQPSGSIPDQQPPQQPSPQNMDDAMKMFKEMFGQQKK